MRTSKRRAEPAADFGPRARLDNGTAVLTYRADPAAPHAPAIRAARAYIRYEHMQLDDASFQAAKRISEAAERCSGARDRDGEGLRSSAFWATGGPAASALEAARTLRELRQVLGWSGAYCVVRCVVDGSPDYEAEARRGLEVMAKWWRL